MVQNKWYYLYSVHMSNSKKVAAKTAHTENKKYPKKNGYSMETF
jgi:hypothetical protein